MSDSMQNNAGDDQLIWQRLNDQLTPTEFAAFNDRLLKDVDFRLRYIMLADLDSSLYDEQSFSSPASAEQLRTKPNTLIPDSRLPGSLLLLAGVMVAGLILAVVFRMAFNIQQPQNEFVKDSQREGSGSAVETRAAPEAFTPDSPRLTGHAAVVVLARGTADDKSLLGRRLTPGLLTLSTGEVQLEFMSGVVMAVSAPAELHIESRDVATIITGTATARVPEKARGFVLNAPGAAVVDLGTEFSVRVDESGTSEVEVVDGEVELSLIGDDGNTLMSQLVREAGRVRVDKKESLLTSMAAGNEHSPQIVDIDPTPLSVTPNYVSSVIASDPVLYWRFEKSQGNMIRNEVADNLNAIIQQSPDQPNGIEFVDGYVRFRRSQAARCLLTEDAIDGLNLGDYSVEFWMNPSDLSHATCLGIFPNEDTIAYRHLSVVEVCTDTFMIHEPGALRFLHRSPPEKSKSCGTNAFTRGICSPGQWQHVVACKSSQSMSVYFNGELASKVPIKAPEDAGSFRMIVGQLNLYDQNDWRQFNGAIDEMAVYDKCLTPSEITEHYQAMNGN